MSAVHIAIIDARVAAGLLDGRKRVESRFARRRRLPYGRISVGDRIYFKVVGGDVIGRCRARRVLQFDNLSPTAIDSLRARYNQHIHASAGYWQAHRHCRYGVLIWLSYPRRPPMPVLVPRQYGAAWILLSPFER